jgi:H+-transporting ATPase
MRAITRIVAVVASSDGGQDPVDQAIREAAAKANAPALKQISFVPFDPASKRSEATYKETGATQRVVKGAFAEISQLCTAAPADITTAQSLELQGFRVLAVAAGAPAALKLIGLIALSDPPRADSAAFIKELTSLGIRTVMVTGDAPETARIVSHQIGLESSVCPPGASLRNAAPQQFAIFAGVLPEEKYRIVKAYQAEKHVVGICGDGANDAPALRQAHLGIAVSSATDIAKAAAGIVLTTPGLLALSRQ